MGMKMRPWGDVHWLFSKININSWHVIASSSFEDRCAAVVEWLQAAGYGIASSALLRISNPPSDHWEKAAPIVSTNFEQLSALLFGPNFQVVDLNLLDQPGSRISIDSINQPKFGSVVLDVTTMPKKFFLFALKLLVNSEKVKNLVVTYSQAESYPESALCENALPPAALPAYGRIESTKGSPRMVVGVGYMPLSIDEMLDSAKHSKLDFIFPFPPASPAFRRNWELLAMLIPSDFPRNTEIHRIHGMDAFEVYERISAWGNGRDLDLLPLGPKPHALGMAMAHMRLGGHAELIYSQPQTYHFEYSKGIARDANGSPKICAYCLKYDGALLF